MKWSAKSTTWIMALVKVSGAMAVIALAFLLSRVDVTAGKCLDSQVVAHVSVMGAAEATGACDLPGLEVLADSRFAEEWMKRRIFSAIRDLDHLSSVMPFPPNRINVVMVTDDPYAYHAGERTVVIGAALAQQPHFLQRTLIITWLQQISRQLADDQMSAAAMADFLLSIHLRQLTFAGIGQTETIDPAALNWFAELSSFRNYCLSPWRAPAHNSFCIQQNSRNASPLTATTIDRMSAWSLRRLAVAGLWSMYDQLGLGAKNQMLKQMITQAVQGRLHLFQDLPGREGAGSLAVWLTASMRRWPGEFLSLRNRETAQNSLLMVMRAMMIPGYADPELELVLLDKGDLAREVLHRLEQTASSAPIVISRNGEKFVMTSAGQRKLESTTPVNHRLIFSCGKVRMSELAGQARKSVLVINVCENQPVNGIEQLAGADLDSFLSQNEGVPYIWMSTSGLKLIRDRDSTDLKLQDQPLTISLLRRMSFWQEDVWDSRLKAFRPKAAVDLVLSHRAGAELF